MSQEHEEVTPEEFLAKYGKINLNRRGRMILPKQKKDRKAPKVEKPMNSAERYFSEVYLIPRGFQWAFEAMAIILGNGKKYTPDFVEFAPEGRIFYEVKQEADNGFKGWTIRATQAKMRHAQMIVEPFGMMVMLATIKGNKKQNNKRIVITEI